MKEVSVKVFDANEWEAVEILRWQGLQPKLARLIVYLGANPYSTQKEIGLGTRMAQSAVSMALACSRDWVEAGVLTDEKGRHRACYRMLKPLSAIVSELEAQEQSKITRLKELVEA